MALTPRHTSSADPDPDDPRAIVLRRFRNFALFWIIILVAYFAGMGWVLDRTKTSTLDALPVFLLITAILIVASGWHAVAIAVMSLNGLFEKTPKRGPWSN